MARYRAIENLLDVVSIKRSITVYHNLAQIFLAKNAYLQIHRLTLLSSVKHEYEKVFIMRCRNNETF